MRPNLVFHHQEQQTDAWFEARRGKITGSKAAPLMSNPSKGSDGLSVGAWTLVEKVAGEILSGESMDSFEGNTYTRRGNDLEPIAKQAYCNYFFVDVEDVGFVEWPNRMAGFSPDGGVICNAEKCLEIKCLNIQKHIHWLRLLDSIDIQNQDQLAKIIDKKHYAQIQWGFYVSGFEFWDLTHFHPKAGKGELSTVTLTPNSKYMDRYAKAHAIVEDKVNEIVKKLKK